METTHEWEKEVTRGGMGRGGHREEDDPYDAGGTTSKKSDTNHDSNGIGNSTQRQQLQPRRDSNSEGGTSILQKRPWGQSQINQALEKRNAHEVSATCRPASLNSTHW